jgi:hypothetical protein
MYELFWDTSPLYNHGETSLRGCISWNLSEWGAIQTISDHERGQARMLVGSLPLPPNARGAQSFGKKGGS